MPKNRYLQEAIEKDLARKMVFIGGPRQVGKTTLSRLIGTERYGKFTYLNWDNPEDKKAILASRFNPEAPLVVFDEIHKYRQWKNYVKGQFDKHKDRFDILVTGSARLDLYQKGGDSLLGRYHYYRLHPFSQRELLHRTPAALQPFEEPRFDLEPDSFRTFRKLLAFGGFPEPLFSGSEETLRRWHNQRAERLVKEDIRDIENVRELSTLQTLVSLLPERVGSALSLNSLREDLGVAHGTVQLWMDILERFYYHFRIYPFASTKIKSLRREAKMYLWDWSEAADPGARLENTVASHLLKFCHFLYDARGYKAELFYLRDIEGREVDFLVTADRKPWFCVEVKNGDQAVSRHIRYFGERLSVPFRYQLVATEGVDFIQHDVRVMSADKFLGGLA
jgi:predicted AAA+ superfamily ATPase